MLNMSTIQEAATGIKEEWGIEFSGLISEEVILHQLARRIVELIEEGPDHFVQLMYRLDISEKKLHGVLGEEDFAEQIARLIYDRQLQKIKSREMHRQVPDDADPDLKW